MDLEAIASDFWQDTGYNQCFPRPIEQALACKLPMTVVKLPDVTVRSVGTWLRKQKHCRVMPTYDSDLMGCLFAHKDHGFIFVCGTDPPDEQRFTLAHDGAHFILDYWLPRLQVIEALGPSIKPVLDGDRRATVEERATAVLAGVRLGPHWHLLPRPGRQVEDEPHVARVEDRADLLGLELVAPKRCILQIIRGQVAANGTNLHEYYRILAAHFGLPAYVFESIVRPNMHSKSPTFLEEALQFLGR
jgi:hypothetical protein